MVLSGGRHAATWESPTRSAVIISPSPLANALDATYTGAHIVSVIFIAFAGSDASWHVLPAAERITAANSTRDFD
jgi:hypothetical protein